MRIEFSERGSIWSLVTHAKKKKTRVEQRLRIRFGDCKIICDLGNSSFKKVGKAGARL